MEPDSRRPEILLDPANQEAFYQSSKLWIESLAERNGLVGQLKVLPNDPDAYPYQRLDVNHLRAYRPSPEEIEQYGQAAIQEKVLDELYGGVQMIIGSDKFDQFSRELQAKSPDPYTTLVGERVIYPPPGLALRTLTGRLRTNDHHVMLVGFHPNITALPIYIGGLVNAIQNNQIQDNEEPFDLFGLTEQIKLPINKSLAFAEYNGRPVAEVVSRFSTVDLKVPSTASSRLFGIDSSLRKSINEVSNQASEEHMAYLGSIGKSALLITDPTGSTAERMQADDGKFNGLRFRRISPGSLDQFEQFNFAWPVTMWWDKNPREAKWHISAPRGLAGGAGASQLIYELAAETGKLAGVDVYFGKSQQALGQTVLESATSLNN